MSGINSINSSSTMTTVQGTRPNRKPDPAEMADQLFSKIDKAGQGYIEKTDLESAFASISGSSTDVDRMFSQLDADSDGKVTKDEFSDKLRQLAQQMDEQFENSRMQGAMEASGFGGMGGMGGMSGMPPPPPPPAGDSGFTKDELTSQLEEIGQTDEKRSSLISSIIENFEAADTDGDGKVSFSEAMAYEQSSNGGSASSGTSASAASTATASNDESEARMMLQIMRLMLAYGGGNEDEAASTRLDIAA